MPASIVWRGCLYAYLSGVGLFALGMAGMFLVGLVSGLPGALSDLLIIAGSFVMLVAFAALYGAVLALPLVGIAFLVNAIFRPTPEAVPWWLPPLILSAIVILITGAPAFGLAGLLVGLVFWRGLRA